LVRRRESANSSFAGFAGPIVKVTIFRSGLDTDSSALDALFQKISSAISAEILFRRERFELTLRRAGVPLQQVAELFRDGLANFLMVEAERPPVVPNPHHGLNREALFERSKLKHPQPRAIAEVGQLVADVDACLVVAGAAVFPRCFALAGVV